MQMKNAESQIIKNRTKNKVSFVEFILLAYSWQFKIMTTGSQLHGTR